jgi:hypothetical protein
MQKWLLFAVLSRIRNGRFLVKRELPSVNYLAGRNCTLYVVRVGVSGDIKRSDPCQRCTELIKHYGIKKIVYSNNEGGFECINSCDYESEHCSSGFKSLGRLGVL